MKKNSFRKMLYLMGVLMLAAMVMVSCKKDDDDDDDPILVEDGIYVAGPSTGFDGLVLSGMMDAGREEGDGFSSNLRDGMYEKFMYLTAGSFNIVEKAGAAENKYGWKDGTQEVINNEGEGDETDGDIHTGEFEANGSDFNAPSDGFYHIILDKTTGKAVYTKINQWAVIGDATDLGWSGEIPMTTKSLSATAGEWEVTDVTLRERGGLKFRYNEGWKITADDFVIFANIGQDGNTGNFINGGGGFPYPATGEGAYTITLIWSIADGWSYTTERTGDVEPLPSVEELFIVGTVNGWSEHDALYMIALDNAVFKGYQYFESADMIKFLIERGSWAGSWGSPQSATDGTITDDNAADIAIGELADFDGDGFYEITADINNETVAITKITTIGVIGGATPGGWDDSTPLDWDAANKVWSGNVEFTDGEYKFRANDDWAINWGGDLDNLSLDGSDITSPGTGNFTVTLSLSGMDPFNATVE